MIKEKLQQLKADKDAVILAHFYVDEEIQKIADYVGDSFYLAQLARKLDNKTIIMAGVYFMGESIKILNPEKTVKMVDIQADCPMAHMVDINKIIKIRREYEDLAVVCYINSTAEIKAYADVCVTSSNALNVVKKLPNKNIFFIPDANLGGYVAGKFKDEKNVILNDGYCPVHNEVRKSDIEILKQENPSAVVLAHPECRGEVLELADYIGSTSGIINEVGKRKEFNEFIIATEHGIGSELKDLYPDTVFHFINSFVCPDMKLMTVEKVMNVLENDTNEVRVDEEVARRAIDSLEKMLELGA